MNITNYSQVSELNWHCSHKSKNYFLLLIMMPIPTTCEKLSLIFRDEESAQFHLEPPPLFLSKISFIIIHDRFSTESHNS